MLSDCQNIKKSLYLFPNHKHSYPGSIQQAPEGRLINVGGGGERTQARTPIEVSRRRWMLSALMTTPKVQALKFGQR